MKKLKLKVLEIGTSRLLTREQLKNIVGGSGAYCTNNSMCPPGSVCDRDYCTEPIDTCGSNGSCPPFYSCNTNTWTCVHI